MCACVWEGGREGEGKERGDSVTIHALICNPTRGLQAGYVFVKNVKC